jgi:predicted MFS family arabinose efflux permease
VRPDGGWPAALAYPWRRLADTYRAAFSGLPREIWLLALTTLVNRSGTMVLPFMTLYLTRKLGFTPVHAGQVLSMYGLGGVAGSFLGGWFSDRCGALRVQGASLIGAGIGFVVLGRLETRAEMLVAVLLVSLIGEAFRPALLTSVALFAPVEVRSRSLALVRLAINLGMSVGPVVGGMLAVHHYGALFVADALTCWAAALALWAFLGRRRPAQPTRQAAPVGRAGSPWRDGVFVVFLALVATLALAFLQIWSTLPLYFREHYGLAEDAIGRLLGLNTVAIVLLEMVVLRGIEHLDHLRVAGFGCFLVCAGFGLMPYGHTAAFAALTILVWTGGEMLSLPLTNAFASLRGDTRTAGRYLGAYTLSFSVAMVLAPIIGTAAYQRFGGAAVWHAISLLGVLLWAGFAILAAQVARRGRPRSGEEPLEAGGRVPPVAP